MKRKKKKEENNSKYKSEDIKTKKSKMPLFGGGPNYTQLTKHSINKLHHVMRNSIYTTLTLFKVMVVTDNIGCLTNAMNCYPHITTLSITYSITFKDSSLLSVSSACDYITSLEFSRCNLLASLTLVLCDALTTNPRIKKLCISKSRLTTTAIKHLSDLLEDPKTTLEDITITNETLDRIAVCSLSLAISNNTSVTHLSLNKNKISAEDSIFIANAVRVNTTLLSLDLSNNSISGECVHTILARGNNTLNTLRINNIEHCYDDLECIASGIEANTSLTSLYMMNLPLYEKSARFVKALACNHTLTDLTFHPRYMDHVLDMLRTNRALQRVVVDDSVWNSSKPDTRELLRLAFYHNPSIRKLNGFWMRFAEFPEVSRRNEMNHARKYTPLFDIMIERCTAIKCFSL